MEPTGQRETAAEIEAAAAQWVARQDRGPLSDAEKRELEQWAATDSRRAGAYARAMTVNLHLNRAAALGNDFPVRAYPAQVRTRRQMIGIAASAVFASVVGLGIFAFNRGHHDSRRPLISTARGAVREITLPEGSRITLNTMTQLRPELTQNQRRIDLVEGEALFDVAHNPARPFVVYAGNFSIKAVGTSFTVHRTAPGAIRVVVAEGIVEVSRREEILGRVHAGISFTVDTATTPVITTLNRSQVDSTLAWRGGRIDLHGMTLAEAAEEFSRYSDVRIRVDDPAIANLHITGVYATNNPAGFAENVALSLGLRSDRRGNEVVITKN